MEEARENLEVAGERQAEIARLLAERQPPGSLRSSPPKLTRRRMGPLSSCLTAREAEPVPLIEST